jgi:hypothetical protein
MDRGDSELHFAGRRLDRGAALLLCAAVGGSAVPHARVETLSGERLELSRDVASGVAVLIVGFTKASRVQTSEWSRRLESDLPRTFAAKVYEVAVLDDVPRLVRGFVIGQIRSSVPKAIHPRFLLVLEHGDVWKRLAGAGDEDAAYLVLVRHGEVAWRGTGKLTDVGYRGLVQALRRNAGSPNEPPMR